MMYNNKLVVCLKANGKVLREFKDTVYIPFGSEYSILIKNLNTVRVQAKITVDGTDLGGGSSFVVAPNGEVELTRFVTNGNLHEGNRLKFIERTSGIEQHRGIKLDDGIIRVEFQYEQRTPQYQPARLTSDWVFPSSGPKMWYGDGPAQPTYGSSSSSSILRSTSAGLLRGGAGVSSVAQSEFNVQAASVSNDVGITVPGSISDQKFSVSGWFPLESETHVVVLRILGETENNTPVVTPVTVKTKQKCTTCGHVNKANAKFCSECGTSLTVV